MRLLKYVVAICLFLSGILAYGQSTTKGNVPTKKTSGKAVADGPNVWGVFEGRAECQPMREVLNVALPENCELLKWAITIYKDPQSNRITSYLWEGSLFRDKPQRGNCKLLKGYSGDSEGKVIQLEPAGSGPTLFLLIGDENVLFVLDKNKKPMVGNDYVNYAFSKVVN